MHCLYSVHVRICTCNKCIIYKCMYGYVVHVRIANVTTNGIYSFYSSTCTYNTHVHDTCTLYIHVHCICVFLPPLQSNFTVFGVITEPGQHTTVVSLYGGPWDRGVPFTWTVVTVDFRNIFPRMCGEDDYYIWKPWNDVRGIHVHSCTPRSYTHCTMH